MSWAALASGVGQYMAANGVMDMVNKFSQPTPQGPPAVATGGSAIGNYLHSPEGDQFKDNMAQWASTPGMRGIPQIEQTSIRQAQSPQYNGFMPLSFRKRF